MIFGKTFAVLSALSFATSLGMSAASEPTESGYEPAIQGNTSTIEGVTGAGGETVFTGDQSELIVRPADGPQPSDQELGLLAPTISCGLNVQRVHASTHVTGTINGVAVVSCNGNAGSIKLHYSLYRVTPNPTSWGAPSESNAGKRSLQNNRAVPCTQGPGTFRGWAQGEITPPPGYKLNGPATNTAFGPSYGVACGVSFAGASNEATPSEITALTFVRSDLAKG